MRLVVLVLALLGAGWLAWRPEPFVQGLALIMVILTALWGISLAIRDASIIDSFWGPGFAILAGWSLWVSPEPIALRDGLLMGLVTVWGLRLGVHIFLRNAGHGEDYRYQQWRRAGGGNWWWQSYLKVFVLQGLLMWVIASPLLVSRFGDAGAELTAFDLAGVVIWMIGFGFEAVGDWQLRRFKANPENQGRIMDQGLWGITRHPNYFGDALLWWGYFLFAVSVGGYWFVFAPIIMTGLLMKVSGVTLLEEALNKKPGYAEYVRSTPAFFPRLW
jgi:steroid 5-alpha reductase family enzyme